MKQVVNMENYSVSIHGDNRKRKLYNVEYEEGIFDTVFHYKNEEYRLSDFTPVKPISGDPSVEWMAGYDGYAYDSAWSGILVRFDADDVDYIYVYRFVVS